MQISKTVWRCTVLVVLGLVISCGGGGTGSSDLTLAPAPTTPVASTEKLYFGYSVEDPANNPEDPTISAMLVKMPSGDATFSGLMPFSYAGCISGQDVGTVRGSRSGRSLVGNWTGTLDGTPVGGSYEGTYDATLDTFSGSYTNAAGKVPFGTNCGFVAANGTWKLFGMNANEPSGFTLSIGASTAPTITWSSAGADALYSLRVFDHDCLSLDPSNATCFLGEAFTTGLSASYPLDFPGATALRTNVKYLAIVTAQSAGTGAYLAFASNTFVPTAAIAGGFLTGVIQVSAGAEFTLALKQDGTVWAWGNNFYPVLGNSAITTISNAPIRVGSLAGMTMISAGYEHGLSLAADGTVWGWGHNNVGQVGDNSTVNRSNPAQIAAFGDVVAIAAGGFHSVALKADGTVWTWGLNGFGQLGDGTGIGRRTPVQVVGLGGVVAVAAGAEHTLALKQDGTVWAWGSNFGGQLGDGSTAIELRSIVPVRVVGLTGVSTIAGGQFHSLAVLSDGTVWVWGSNTSGQLGTGVASAQQERSPIQVPGLSDVIAASGHQFQSTVLKSDGTLWAWGTNQLNTNIFGLLGDGTSSNRYSPVQVVGMGDVVAFDAGGLHTTARKSDGSVWSWGYNGVGQLGIGSHGATPELSPSRVVAP